MGANCLYLSLLVVVTLFASLLMWLDLIPVATMVISPMVGILGVA